MSSRRQEYRSKVVTDEDIAAMEEALEQIKEQEQEIALAESAGIDVAASKENLRKSKETAQMFLAVYKKKR
jgi:predicted PP-loop superfamily ATPase